jgi:hypothetical protein
MISKYFLTVTDRLKSDYTEIGSAMSFLKSSFPKGFPKMAIICFTAAEGMT